MVRLPLVHEPPGVNAVPGGLSALEQRGNLWLRDHVDNQGRGRQLRRIEWQGIIRMHPQRGGIDDQIQCTDLRQVFCFGNCALGPTASVAGRLHGRVTPERLDALIDDTQAGSSTP